MEQRPKNQAHEKGTKEKVHPPVRFPRAVLTHFVAGQITRYKFVIDRAKKLLENTDLASLRRAVETDMHPPTAAGANTNLAVQEQAIGGRHFPLSCHDGGGHNGTRSGLGGLTEAHRWDRFVLPISARRRISSHTARGNLLGAPWTSALIPPPRDSLDAGGGRGAKLRAKYIDAGRAPGAGSTRTRARRVLSLGHLSISSKTVLFPRGHVPSVMGAKGHGKKRGRINHFAVRTPPPSSSRGGSDDGTGGGRERYAGDGVGLSDGPLASSQSGDARGRRALAASGCWSLPHELDPTSTVTSPGKTGEGSGAANNYSVHTTAASRVSTCDTINSPGRVAAIMLGVTGTHTALPPPRSSNSDGDGSSTSGGISRLDSASFPDIDFDDSSLADSQRGRSQPVLLGTNVPGRNFVNDDIGRAGRALRHHPTGGGSGGKVVSGAGAAGHESNNLSGVDGCVFPPTGCSAAEGGGTSGNAPPLLRRALGSGVRDQPPPSLVVVPGDGGSRGGGGVGARAVLAAPLSNGSTLGRWRSDDDGTSSISSVGGGGSVGGVGAEDGAETPLGKKPEQSPVGFTSAGPPDEQGGTAFFATKTGEEPPRREALPRECDTPAIWVSDDPAGVRGIVSGESEPPSTRSKSALRGWSVDRPAPACSPLVTQKRGAQSEAGR